MTARSRTTTLLVLGDSLAAGWGLQQGQSFPSLLREKAEAAGLPLSIINAGLSGDTSAGGLRRIGPLLEQPVDILLLELGANDGLQGISHATTAANLQAIIDAAKRRHPDIRVIVAGMRMPEWLGAEFVRKFGEIFPELATRNEAALVPFLLEGVGGIPHLNLADRVHPNAEGQRILADNVWHVLRPMLESAFPQA